MDTLFPCLSAETLSVSLKDLGLVRFDLKYSNGTLPHDKLMKSIELFGTKVMPAVRASQGGSRHNLRQPGPFQS